MKNNNGAAIRRLSARSLKNNRIRNLFAMMAIILTGVLFTAVFSLTSGIMQVTQEEIMQEVGGKFHAGLKEATKEQFEKVIQDPLIKEYNYNIFIGIADNIVKRSAELRYLPEEDWLENMFVSLEEGRLPVERNEIIVDTFILDELGLPHELGVNVPIRFSFQGKEIEEEFVVCGYYEGNYVAHASELFLSENYWKELKGGLTDEDFKAWGKVHLEEKAVGLMAVNLFFYQDSNLEDKVCTVIRNAGYEPGTELKYGVNWAYVRNRVESVDMSTILLLGAVIVIILITGYLIIYNIFQISVSEDIRFYGLLKTIGTTGKQIRRMIRRQALFLSVAGIPLGLVAGSLSGIAITPIIINTMSIGKSTQAFSPWFFAVAVAFSIVTVLISCAKPGRIAARVSPVEAVRYTDTAIGARKQKKSRAAGKPLRMAKANLGRNKKKTVLVVVSMTLAVVLLQLTVTFVDGFDMDKYLAKWVVSDFILGDASYFQPGADRSGPMPAVAAEDISRLEKTGNITENGRVYGHRGDFSVYAPKDASRDLYKEWMSDDQIKEMLSWREQDADGNYAMDLNLYGLEDYAMDQLQVIDGDLADVYDPNQRAIAAVYLVDDYDKPMNHTQWAKVGDTVTIHYVYAYEYIDNETGEKIPEEEIQTYQLPYSVKETEACDIEYRVAACVTMKHAMSYRYTGAFEYVLNAQTFQKDSHTDDVMIWLFQTEPEKNAVMYDFLQDYTVHTNPNLDFESKQSYVQQFEQYRSMFLLIGSALSFVVGIVGVLNYFNAVLTSIYSRRREFAMLQSIGMTGRQLKRMLICEGMIYGAAAIALSLVLSFLMIPLMDHALGGPFWFFTYQFTIVPILFMIPVFAALGVALPLVSYWRTAGQTIVERLRESE